MDVQDTDGDGLLDRWETSTAGNDPFGKALPDLAGMGANPCRKDLFVELGYFSSKDGWNTQTSAIQPAPGPHTHLPSKQVLNLAAESFKNAPVPNDYPGCAPPDGWTSGIAMHFAAGDVGQTSSDQYIIPAALSRGGEAIEEAACVPSPTVTCQFPGYEGIVGWKSGFHYYKDAAVDPATGAQLLPVDTEGACEPNCERRRFDRNRKDMFHYLLFAHALGLPKNFCLNPTARQTKHAG